jgi:hypothetical protein
MTDQKVWFVTGAGRGMGVVIARAALAAGNAEVATARKPRRSRRPWATTMTSWPSSSMSPTPPTPRRLPSRLSIDSDTRLPQGTPGPFD